MCEEERGTVKVIDGRYKFNGKFHFPSPNTPIRNEEGALMGVTNPRDIVHVHMYGKEASFFDGVSKGKLLATKCVNDECPALDSVFIPYRIHCPDCLALMEEVDITDIANKTSTVHSFMVTERTGAFNSLPTPIRFINIEFEGVCTILMGYLSADITPYIGMKVVPIFNTATPTYTIMDLSWVPEGTPAEDLPENFSFA